MSSDLAISNSKTPIFRVEETPLIQFHKDKKCFIICIHEKLSWWTCSHDLHVHWMKKVCIKVLLLFAVISKSLWPHGLQHARPSCPIAPPEVCPSSCPLYSWCHPAITSSDTLFSFCLQSFQASGAFPMSWLFASDGHNTGASASASVLPMSIQDWVPLRPFWSLCHSRDFQEYSLAPLFESTSSLLFYLLYCPALTTVHDHREDHSPDYMNFHWQRDVCFSTHCLGLSYIKLYVI